MDQKELLQVKKSIRKIKSLCITSIIFFILIIVLMIVSIIISNLIVGIICGVSSAVYFIVFLITSTMTAANSRYINKFYYKMNNLLTVALLSFILFFTFICHIIILVFLRNSKLENNKKEFICIPIGNQNSVNPFNQQMNNVYSNQMQNLNNLNNNFQHIQNTNKNFNSNNSNEFSLEAKLKKLNELKLNNKISEAEFNTLKQKLINKEMQKTSN